MQLDKPGTEKIRKARDDREKHLRLQEIISQRSVYSADTSLPDKCKIAVTGAYCALER